MKLARVIRTGGTWVLTGPNMIVDKPPVGTIVQYDVYGDTFRVCFPGVRGYAPIGREAFDMYFEDLDDEAS